MLEENRLKKKLSKGEPVLGTWAVVPSPVVVDIIASTGVDFIVIDGEHGPISFETAQTMALACESRGITPMMRVSGARESDILRALDIGVHGIHVPNVTQHATLQAIVKYAKYPPAGGRGFSPFTRAGDYGGAGGHALTNAANQNVLTVIHIEGTEALKDLDAILEVEHLDVVFVGLFDLSKALGKPGQVNDTEVLSYLDTIVGKIRDSGKHAGTIAVSAQTMGNFINMGIQYITYLVDCDLLRSAYMQVVEQFKHIQKSTSVRT